MELAQANLEAFAGTLLELALRLAIEQTHAAGRPVRLLDIASGPGRYILETIRQLDAIRGAQPSWLPLPKPCRAKL